ncbi:SPOR domain-containing protein [Hymenobacter sp. BT683]|uniref:SPOR domain-containing protein n=1 Tax=Hymenobacter jeongseonensis TaxID=2791027 RepID=A0ABS0IKS4_9BACT|nr:SPOR domain-containing protein [Hymenobacter jeongseonensis]MBF9238956.1 SPOR domain-containing protein [Hymenobacter jeongseonensis]
MHLADHIRPLLRDHDCVIIPDFGGLVADVSSARAQPGRQVLSPPTKLVAFNQALTRNDGLLVDALSQHLGLSIAQAREAVRTAVAGLKQELDETNRTELPGIGIFRRAAGRGLAFEYTGTDNLLASAFGLPQLAARPVRANDARPKRPQPVLRGGATRRPRWARLLPVGVIAFAASLLLLANYQVALNAGYLPTAWQTQLPKLEWAQRPASTTSVSEPQQATLGQHDFNSSAAPLASEGMTPLETSAATSAPVVAPQPATVPALNDAKPEASKVVSSAIAAPNADIVEKSAIKTSAEATSTSEAKAPAVAARPAAVAAPVAKAVESSTTIKSRTGRYYVIAGAYRTLAHAERGRKALTKTGHATHIILPPAGSRLFRVTAADYADLASAQREAQRLRITQRSDFNTLKF